MSKLIYGERLFRPVQPRFKEGGEGITYKEFLPDPSLSGYICCYWELKSTTHLPKPFLYNVVADGCIDFFFDLVNTGENYVMGFSSEHTQFSLEGKFSYAGVRFFPGAFPIFYHIKASELTNKCYYISDIAPHVSQGLEGLLNNNRESLKPALDRYFLKMAFSNSLNIDLRFLESLEIILKSEGALKIQNDIDTCISKRQLRRLFDFYIGASPKEFNKIVRFQKFLNRSATRNCLRKGKLYYDLGYYDQSHFIKDFKTLYGVTPLQAFIN